MQHRVSICTLVHACSMKVDADPGHLCAVTIKYCNVQTTESTYCAGSAVRTQVKPFAM